MEAVARAAASALRAVPSALQAEAEPWVARAAVALAEAGDPSVERGLLAGAEPWQALAVRWQTARQRAEERWAAS